MRRLAENRFEGIVFDAYGTLFDVTALDRACEQVANDPTRFVQLWRTKQLEYSFLRTIMDQYADFEQVTVDALDYAVAALDAEITASQRHSLMDVWLSLPPFPDVPPALNRLRSAGQRLVILSNGTRRMLEPLLQSSGLVGHFQDVLTSERVQTYKPEASIYTLPGERLHARNYELLFVTANGFDVAGAKAAGFAVCRINRFGLPLDRLGYEPDMTVSDFDQLADLVLGSRDTP